MRDHELRRVWGLEVFNDIVVGCTGPFSDETAFRECRDTIVFERNPDLLRHLGRKRRQRVAHRTRSTTDVLWALVS